MEEETPLTADDIKAIRTADDFDIMHRDGVTTIRLSLRYSNNDKARAAGAFTVAEQKLFPNVHDWLSNYRVRDIAAASTFFGFAAPGDAGIGDTIQSANAIGYANVYDSKIFTTIAAIARPGDTISFHWVADNNNENIRSVGFHRDEVFARITAPAGRTGTANMRAYLLLSSRVGPHDSSRMIRRA